MTHISNQAPPAVIQPQHKQGRDQRHPLLIALEAGVIPSGFSCEGEVEVQWQDGEQPASLKASGIQALALARFLNEAGRAARSMLRITEEGAIEWSELSWKDGQLSASGSHPSRPGATIRLTLKEVDRELMNDWG